MKMKKIRIVVILIFCIGLIVSTQSCTVLIRKDNGKHKGWYKNTNNPHNPYSSKHGKSYDKDKKQDK